MLPTLSALFLTQLTTLCVIKACKRVSAYSAAVGHALLAVLGNGVPSELLQVIKWLCVRPSARHVTSIGTQLTILSAQAQLLSGCQSPEQMMMPVFLEHRSVNISTRCVQLISSLHEVDTNLAQLRSLVSMWSFCHIYKPPQQRIAPKYYNSATQNILVKTY